MLGYKGENVAVLDVMSDASAAAVDSDSDGEEQYVMDPSDPRAHEKTNQKLKVHPTNSTSRSKKKKKGKKGVSVATGVSRWDSDSTGQSTGDDDEEEDEDLGERIPIEVVFKENDDEDVEDTSDPQANGKNPSTKAPVASSVKLSKWALSRFMVPRDERNVPVMEELPMEPLNDHILSDFSSRFRGKAGDVEVEKVIEDLEQDSDEGEVDDKFTVGAPLFSTEKRGPQVDSDGGELVDGAVAAGKRKPDADESAAKDGKSATRKRRENRYFITDLATKCFNCGQIGHMSSLCMNDRVRCCFPLLDDEMLYPACTSANVSIALNL